MNTSQNDRQPQLHHHKKKKKHAQRPGASRWSTPWTSALLAKKRIVDNIQRSKKLRPAASTAHFVVESTAITQPSVAAPISPPARPHNFMDRLSNEHRSHNQDLQSDVSPFTIPSINSINIITKTDDEASAHQLCLQNPQHNVAVSSTPSVNLRRPFPETEETSVLHLSFDVQADIHLPPSLFHKLNAEEMRETIQSRLSKQITSQLEEKIADAFSTWTAGQYPLQMRHTPLSNQIGERPDDGHDLDDSQHLPPTPTSCSPLPPLHWRRATPVVPLQFEALPTICNVELPQIEQRNVSEEQEIAEIETLPLSRHTAVAQSSFHFSPLGPPASSSAPSSLTSLLSPPPSGTGKQKHSRTELPDPLVGSFSDGPFHTSQISMTATNDGSILPQYHISSVGNNPFITMPLNLPLPHVPQHHPSPESQPSISYENKVLPSPPQLPGEEIDRWV
ncbi:hypothetical protein H0H87_004841 [Tephrocybe sp. NHM501043]|nr:hypothetical protein H0H87_004841 [Tephrocybe sp. NHM501043]